MANQTGDGEVPVVVGSPNEDFNPLDEDLQVPVDVDQLELDIDPEEESPCSSIEADGTDAFQQYGVTPPHTRAVKRGKARIKSNYKTGSKTDLKEYHVQAVKVAGKARVMHRGRIMRDSLGDDVVSCNIDELGPDDIFEPSGASRTPSKKKDTSKNFKTSRAYERDYKRSSGDLTSLENSVGTVTLQPIKVDSPQQFRCLQSQPVVVNPAYHDSPLIQRRQSTQSNVECPKDRFQFHRTFSMLINLGNIARKEKESKIRPYNRQLSSEQEVWQTQISDLLWLELQAWFKGCTMKNQDTYLCKAREQVPEILQEILNFRVKSKVQSPQQCENCADKLGTILETHGEQPRKHEQTAGTSSPSGPCPNCSQHSNNNTKGVAKSPSQRCLRNKIEQQKDALLQVSKLLRKLEKVERLYPTSKAVGISNSVYGSERFQRRVNTLCLWRNITRDIGHKLQLMSQVLCLDHMHYAVDWPWLDYNVYRQGGADHHLASPPDVLRPDICVTHADDEEEEDSEDDSDEDSYHITQDGGGVNAYSPNTTPPRNNKLDKNVRFKLSGSVSSESSMSPSPSFLPMDISTPKRGEAVVRSLSAASSLSRTSSSQSVDDMSRTSIYRYFVDRMLRKTGLRKLLMRLKDILDGTLQRARQTLEQPPQTCSSPFSPLQTLPPGADALSSSPSLDGLPSIIPSMDRRVSLATHGVWSEDFQEMGLPSFKPAFLCLLRIPLDVVHESLRLRLEQRPEADPSYMSVRQLIRECKEVLLGAVTVKQYYQQMVGSVSEDDGDCDKFEMDLEQFEEDMQSMMEVYFDYIRTWMVGLQDMPVMSKRLKNFLEEEWNFTKQVCPHILAGEASAGKKFCLMASSLLHSISDYLETGMDEGINQLYDSTLQSGDSQDDQEHSDGEDEEEAELQQYLHNKRSSRSGELRQAIIQTCRTFKELFHEARERASKALGFAKMLRKDLEIAADFNIAVTATELLAKLRETRHVRVLAPVSAGYLMFIPECISRDEKRILPLLNVTCGREDATDAMSSDGYLLLVKCEGCLGEEAECPQWNGPTQSVVPTAEITVALSHIEVESLFLVVMHSTQLGQQRKEFEKLLGSAVQLVSEQTSCHQAIAESLSELKSAAIALRERVAYAIGQVDEKLNLEDIAVMDDSDKHNIQKLYRETLHQCYNFGFEYHREVTRLVSGEVRSKLSHMLVQFAKQWMKFVTQKCERGRGVRPRWAGQGLDFLIVACEPRVLAILTEDEFAELKHCINNTITHVIGDKGLGPFSAGGGFRVASPDVTAQKMMRNISVPEPLHPRRSISVRSTQSEPPTPYTPTSADPSKPKSLSSVTLERQDSDVEVRAGKDGGIVLDIVHPNVDGSPRGEDTDDDDDEPSTRQRIMSCIHQLEHQRNNQLYKKRVIGWVTNQQKQEYHINVRKVNFRWQRGIKIGEGQFGKVYTAVNMETGELMAMKEIRLQPNDHQTLKDISDELKIFEGICHPSLVKYFGVEVHREEMLIFMEYCAEGTLEEAAQQGLPEDIIRKYTCEILVGVSILHDHGIVHRDIKGANIFLTSKGLKLGDFGSCVKLKNHTTMPGEVNNLVGTTAFMAPEVITRGNESEGSGRASDIWSLGCVVIEMASGKRPWHELENNFSIMFKVGMGGSPTIPDTLSVEGKDFLQHCLQTDSKLRWTASQLQDHAFVKVYLDEV